MAGAARFAKPSAFFLDETKTRHWPPSFIVSMQRLVSSYFVGVLISFSSSEKWSVPL